MYMYIYMYMYMYMYIYIKLHVIMSSILHTCNEVLFLSLSVCLPVSVSVSLSVCVLPSLGDRSSTQYYNVQYTEGVACGYHKVEHLRLRIYSLHSTVL